MVLRPGLGHDFVEDRDQHVSERGTGSLIAVVILGVARIKVRARRMALSCNTVRAALAPDRPAKYTRISAG